MQILGDSTNSMQSEIEVVYYIDDDQHMLYLPERKNLVLQRVANRLGRCPVAVAMRPGIDDQPHGQFDDVLWVQLARARMALLGLEAVEKSVQAPLAVPSDTQSLALGPDSIIRSANPEKIRRVGIEIPQGAFAENQLLDQDMRMGARYPESRGGSINASVITGRGIQELQGGFDQQVKTAQVILGHALMEALEICFDMDEKFWPNTKKTVRGTANGTPFEETYTPAKDIAGDHTVEVTYGFAAGMDPNRALVFLLQLRGDQDIPRSMVQRSLPMDVDVEQMQREIDVEQIDDALKQGLFSMLGAIGILAQQGQDPTALITKSAAVIEKREKGMALHQAILEAFAPTPPPEPPPPAPGSEQPPAPGLPGSGGDQAQGGGGDQGNMPPFGIRPSGLPQGVAPGQAAAGPGGRPDLAMLVAGLTGSGAPNLSASVSRRIPA